MIKNHNKFQFTTILGFSLSYLIFTTVLYTILYFTRNNPTPILTVASITITITALGMLTKRMLQ
jgi:hypothetical protein